MALCLNKQAESAGVIRQNSRGDECAIKFVWLLAHEQEPPLLVDVCFAWILTLGQRGTGRPLRPKRVEFQRPLTHREIYEEHFRCPVKFKATQNALIFTKSDTDLPFVTYNADLLATVAPQLEAELSEQLATTRAENFQRTSKGHFEAVARGAASGDTGSR
jgi:hypothetical protein